MLTMMLTYLVVWRLRRLPGRRSNEKEEEEEEEEAMSKNIELLPLLFKNGACEAITFFHTGGSVEDLAPEVWTYLEPVGVCTGGQTGACEATALLHVVVTCCCYMLFW